MLIPFFVVGYLHYNGGKQTVVSRYRTALEQAHQAGDTSRVQLYDFKLARLGAGTEASTFNRALKNAEEGRLHDAYLLMQSIAPLSSAGYPGAHIWLCEQLLANRMDISSELRGKAIDRHLDHLQTLGYAGDQLTKVRATRLIEKGQLAAAADLLRPAAEDDPDVAFKLLALDLAVGQSGAVRDDARTVLHHVQSIRRNRPSEMRQVYFTWVTALEILGRTAELETAFNEWLAADPNNEYARAGLLEIYESRLQRPKSKATLAPETLAELLQSAERLDASSAWLRSQVAQICELRDDSPMFVRTAEKTIQLLLEDTRTGPSMLAAIGGESALHGDLELALRCFQRLTVQAPDNAVGWNNYAWVLANVEQPRLEQALAAVDMALQLEPNEPRFYETRGQIHVKSGSWQRAITDLSTAAEGMEETRQIHQSLALAYEALGKMEHAEKHRQMAGQETDT